MLGRVCDHVIHVDRLLQLLRLLNRPHHPRSQLQNRVRVLAAPVDIQQPQPSTGDTNIRTDLGKRPHRRNEHGHRLVPPRQQAQSLATRHQRIRDVHLVG